MKNLSSLTSLYFSMCLLSNLSFSQIPSTSRVTEITYEGEIRMGNDSKSSQNIPYAYFRGGASVSIADTTVLCELDGFDDNKRTYLRMFATPFLESHLKGRNNVPARINITHIVPNSSEPILSTGDITIHFNPNKRRGERFVSLLQPILVGAPESFTVYVMVSELEQLIATYNQKDLIRDINRYLDQKPKIGISDLISLYDFKRTLDPFLVPGSFFGTEANKLKVQIDQIRESILSKKDTNQLTYLLRITELYSTYLKQRAEAENISNNISLVLFQQANAPIK